MVSVSVFIFLCGVGVSSVARAASGSSPCGIVAQKASSGTTTVTAKLAYECLTSIPINEGAAVNLVESILPYVEWQSDLEYLDDPPKGYQEPAIDVIGSLKEIIREIKKGGYDNEHEFQAELFQTFNAAHDGHFRFVPDLLSRVAFRRRVQLVSVSRDGTELPRVYVKNDIYNYTRSSTFNASAVTRVNGRDVNRYLEEVAQQGFLQDPDALYNALFYELAIDAQYANMQYTGAFAGAGRASMTYQGAETKLEFADGTSRTYENYAEVIGNWRGVVDGPSAYEKFCTGPKVYDPATDDEEFMAGDVGYAHGYPTPKGISSDKQISGYFLDDDPAFADVAVLSMLSFEPFYPAEYQNVIERFIFDAKAAGKSKIVIDLSGNGGGIILNGYDAFRQFFPQTVQDGFSRFREHDAFNIMSKQISNFTSGFSAETASTTQVVAAQSVLDYRFDLNQTNQNFLTYDDKFSPQKFRNDEADQPEKKPRGRAMNFSTPKTPNDSIVVPKRRKPTRSSTGKVQDGNGTNASALESSDYDRVELVGSTTVNDTINEATDSSNQPTIISLPFSDTPVINRNKEMRKQNKGTRRSSLGLRGRRASSLIENGHSAIPHREVEASEFYKHIEADGLSEPRRMRQLLSWTAERELGEKPSHGEANDLSEQAARTIKEGLLKDFSNKSEYSDWFSREDTAPKKVVKKPNPRNNELELQIEESDARIKLLKQERDQWKALAKSRPSLPPIIPPNAQEINPSDIDTSMLSPEQANILTTISSFSALDLRDQVAKQVQDLLSGLEFKLDQFADGVHKLEQYKDTAGRAASKILSLSAVRLEERDRLEKEAVGTRDLPMQEVLRSLSRILPESDTSR